MLKVHLEVASLTTLRPQFYSRDIDRIEQLNGKVEISKTAVHSWGKSINFFAKFQVILCKLKN